jgi:hypothetical protein
MRLARAVARCKLRRIVERLGKRALICGREVNHLKFSS